MPAFIDTSIVLSRLFSQAPQLADPEWNTLVDPHASELVRVESCRTIERLKLESNYSDKYFAESLAALETMLSGFTLVPLDPLILSRACQPLGVRIKTLDAIHLSTALLLRDQDASKTWTFFTHDTHLKNAALTCGFQVKG